MLIQGRINTRNLLYRKSFFLSSYNCVLCEENSEETALHLFFDCPFAINCWETILNNKRRGISVWDECCFTRDTLPKKIAMDILIMGCWNIWMQRNNNIFHNVRHGVTSWRLQLKKDLLILGHRIKHKYAELLHGWIDSALSLDAS